LGAQGKTERGRGRDTKNYTLQAYLLDEVYHLLNLALCFALHRGRGSFEREERKRFGQTFQASQKKQGAPLSRDVQQSQEAE
jgi:hypothetical protein